MQAWRTERNKRTVNAQGAPSLIRCKPGEMNESCGTYERCSRFVTAFAVRTDRKSKLQTESVRVYWTCVGKTLHNGSSNQAISPISAIETYIAFSAELGIIPPY